MSENNSNNATDTLFVSTDAMPIPPRQPQESTEDQNAASEQNNQRQDEPTVSEPVHQTTEPLESMPDPPKDWNFNILLNKLADNLSPDDLSKMKSLFEGEGGIGKGVQEKIESPSDFFRIMRTRGYINRENLLYLQGILFLIGRKDLIKDAVEYSRTVENVLHLYAPSYQPENGYKYVKFHVAGKDFNTYSRNDVALLRRKVASVLFVPEKYVIIMGIEPSLSLVITLMIPDMYVEILQELLEKGDDFVDLQDNGVDTVEIDGKAVYKITGTRRDVLVETEQHAELVNVYDQLQQAKIRLDNSEMSCIDLSRQIENLRSEKNTTKKKLRKVKNELHSLQKVFSMSRDDTQPATLKELSSLEEFTESLHQIDIETVGKKEFQRVLDATVSIISTGLKEHYKIREQMLLLQLQDMQSQVAPLLLQLERYKISSKLSDTDKSLLDRLLLQPLIAQTEVTLSDHGHQILAAISSKLSKKDKEKLRQKYQWTPGGQIEKFMEQDPNRFLAGIFYKEVETKRRDIDFETFVAQCLSAVDREDLKKFVQQEYTQQYPSQHRQEQPVRPEQQSKGQHHQQQYQDQSILLTRMAQQIQEMHTSLKARQNMFDPKFQEWKAPCFPFASQAFQKFQQ